MNLYSREAAIEYLQAHGRSAAEESIAEYFSWLDDWIDSVVNYDEWEPIPTMKVKRTIVDGSIRAYACAQG